MDTMVTWDATLRSAQVKHQTIINKFQSILSMHMFITTLVLTGCTTLNLPEYTIQSGSSAQHLLSQTNDGLFVTVEFFYDEEKIKQYFGVYLLEKNILPVFILVENHNSSSSFLLFKENFFLNKSNNKELMKPTNIESVSSSAGEGIAIAGAALISSPLMLIGAQMVADTSVINHNIITKEFRKETISPGGKQKGFVYFQLQEKYNPIHLYNVNMNIINVNSREVVNLTFTSK